MSDGVAVVSMATATVSIQTALERINLLIHFLLRIFWETENLLPNKDLGRGGLQAFPFCTQYDGLEQAH
jgi:hypothetical protein